MSIMTDTWKFLVSILTPILFLCVPYLWHGHTGKEPYAAYVVLVMVTFWMTECIPLAVTSFMPVILFPLFGIISSDKISSVYLQDSILFLFGGVVIALAVEYSNLHTRIAIKVILVIGAKIPRLLLGIMMTTMILSMWMNNTSTCAMMVPIVNAIMGQLKSQMLSQSHQSNSQDGKTEMEMKTMSKENTLESAQDETDNLKIEKQDIDQKIDNLHVMFLLATAYSSNIGGTGVITGSATNIIVLDLVRKDADQAYCPEECRKYLQIGFLDWMVFNLVPMTLNTLFCWLYLQVHFIGFPLKWKIWKNKREKAIHRAMTKMDAVLTKSVGKAIQKKYDELGEITFHEIGVSIIFIITIFLWIFKDPQVINGWDSLPIFAKTASGKSFIKEATPTLLMCVFLFAIPKKTSYYKDFAKGGLGEGLKDPLLTWRFVNNNFPWGIFILLGGGSALAKGARVSGLNKWMGEILETSEILKTLPASVLFILILCMVCILTTVASNTAIAAVLTPVLLNLVMTDLVQSHPIQFQNSYVRELHPLYMILATGSACSYAFMLPVSTPPNAIVYGSSTKLRIGHMVKAGFIINVICILVLYLTTHTVSNLFFNFDGYNNECKNMTILSAQFQ